jgi:hypothetical protein
LSIKATFSVFNFLEIKQPGEYNKKGVSTTNMKNLIARINKLSRKKREQGLSPQETKEQKELWDLYLKNIRSQITGALESAGYKPKKKQEEACGCEHCSPREVCGCGHCSSGNEKQGNAPRPDKDDGWGKPDGPLH